MTLNHLIFSLNLALIPLGVLAGYWISRLRNRAYPLAMVMLLIPILLWGLRGLRPGLFYAIVPCSGLDWFSCAILGCLGGALIFALRERVPRLKPWLWGLPLIFLLFVGHRQSYLLDEGCYEQLRDTVAPDGFFRIQSSGTSCMPTSIANYFRLKGVPLTEPEVARQALFDPAFGMLDLQTMDTLNAFGASRGWKGDLLDLGAEDLTRMETPCITSISYNFASEHAILILSIENGKAQVVDPLVGKQEWPLGDLKARWRGRYLVMHNTNRETLPLKTSSM